MKAVVTGGAGFIGSNLAIELISLGHEVTVVDDLSSGYFENIERIPSLDFITVDVIDRGIVDKAMNGASVVFHLAASEEIQDDHIPGLEIVLWVALTPGSKNLHLCLHHQSDNQSLSFLSDSYAWFYLPVLSKTSLKFMNWINRGAMFHKSVRFPLPYCNSAQKHERSHPAPVHPYQDVRIPGEKP